MFYIVSIVFFFVYAFFVIRVVVEFHPRRRGATGFCVCVGFGASIGVGPCVVVDSGGEGGIVR
jgi:hypothetical protein